MLCRLFLRSRLNNILIYFVLKHINLSVLLLQVPHIFSSSICRFGVCVWPIQYGYSQCSRIFVNNFHIRELLTKTYRSFQQTLRYRNASSANLKPERVIKRAWNQVTNYLDLVDPCNDLLTNNIHPWRH